MILVRPRQVANRDHRGHWHRFVREDNSGRWVTDCGWRLDLAEFQSGHPSYIDCKKCRKALDLKGAA